MKARSVIFHVVFAGLLGSLAACDTGSKTNDASASASASAMPAAGTAFNDCKDASWCPTLVVIPAGKFLMGSPATEPGRFDDEGPQHEVSIASFAVGKHDVTKDQWAEFAKDTGWHAEPGCAYAPPEGTWSNPGFPQEGNHPVVCVSWPDAQAYVKWLSRKTGKSYRLPTEAEWEYAARAGTRSAYPWGAKALHDFANYGEDECCAPRTAERDKWLGTSPVGSFPANAFGLFDMHGNVFQWVEDCHGESYAGAPIDGSAVAPRNCSQRVARGGVFGDRPDVMRSAARNFAPPPGDTMTISNYRSAGFGFRVVRQLP